MSETGIAPSRQEVASANKSSALEVHFSASQGLPGRLKVLIVNHVFV